MAELSTLSLGADAAVRRAVIARGREVVRIEAEALQLLEAMIDDQFVAACEAILTGGSRLVITGMGKSGHIGRKLAATFAATGTPALFIHPAEAAHGDLGMLMPGDVLLVLSNSGNTAELRAILDYARRRAIRIIGIGSRRSSQLMNSADIRITLPKIREACAENIAPTTSTVLQLAVGDALALAVMDRRGVTRSTLHALHPAGDIGVRLTPVAEVMHGADRLPLVSADTGMADVISVITNGRFGLAGVVDGAGDIVGVISDGDLRRYFNVLPHAVAADVMTKSPRSMPGDMLVEDALLFLNDAKITCAFVVDRHAAQPARPVGIVHIHDLLQFGLN